MRLKVSSVTFAVTLLVFVFVGASAVCAQAQTTVLRAVVGEMGTDHHVTVTIEVGFLGIENALGGSLNYDPAELSYVGFKNPLTYPSATIFVNPLRVAEGKLGFLYGFPAGRVFPAGNGKILSFEFVVLKPGKLSLNFTDTPVVREVVNVRAIPIPSGFIGGVVETPLPSLAFFYAGPTRGVGPAYVLVGGLEGADKGVVVAFTDYDSAGEGGEVVGEINPGEAKRFVYPARTGITYFRVFPVSNGSPWGTLPWTTAVGR